MLYYALDKKKNRKTDMWNGVITVADSVNPLNAKHGYICSRF